MRLLLVEDDELLGDGIQAVPAGIGYEVEWRIFMQLAGLHPVQLPLLG